jgi:hypothetical protein
VQKPPLCGVASRPQGCILGVDLKTVSLKVVAAAEFTCTGLEG